MYLPLTRRLAPGWVSALKHVVRTRLNDVGQHVASRLGDPFAELDHHPAAANVPPPRPAYTNLQLAPAVPADRYTYQLGLFRTAGELAEATDNAIRGGIHVPAETRKALAAAAVQLEVKLAALRRTLRELA